MNFAYFLQSQNVVAFLDMIGKSEGADYNTLFGGGTFSDYSKHPDIKFHYTDKSGKTIITTAAGKYQITYTTWLGLQSQYGFTDFTPATQDKAAIALISGRDALMDIYKGNFQTAIDKCHSEWASLPSSTVPQPHRTIDQVVAWYKQAGGNIA